MAPKSFLPGHSGIQKLASGDVVGPVAGVLLTLPAGFRRFRLQLDGFLFSVSDNLSAAFSFDEAATFAFDNTNFDAYGSVFVAGLAEFVTPGFSSHINAATGAPDSLIDLSQLTNYAVAGPASPVFVNARLDIEPGSPSKYASLFFSSNTLGEPSAGSNKAEYGSGWAFAAGGIAAVTVPYSAARATHLLLQPYGDGAAPQASGHTIVAGSYALFGE